MTGGADGILDVQVPRALVAKPDIAVCFGFTNDINIGAMTDAAAETMVLQYLDGMEPLVKSGCLCVHGMVPRTSSADTFANSLKINFYLQKHCSARDGHLYVDVFSPMLLTSTGAGSWKTNYSSDGVHPNSVTSTMLVGNIVYEAIAPYLQPNAFPAPEAQAAGGNILPDAVFGSIAAIPSGWLASGGPIDTYSNTADATYRGRGLAIRMQDTTGGGMMAKYSITTGVTVGNVYRIGAWCKPVAAVGGANTRVWISFQNSSDVAQSTVDLLRTNALTTGGCLIHSDFRWYSCEVVVPATVTNIDVFVGFNADASGPSDFEFGDLQITDLGVAADYLASIP